MNAQPAFDPSTYRWEPQPAAARFVSDQLGQAIAGSSWLSTFRHRLLRETGTRLVDWLDHIVVPAGLDLAEVGFTRDHEGRAWEHRAGLFPRLLVSDTSFRATLAIKVERLDDFLAAHEFDELPRVHGSVAGDFRLAEINLDNGARLRVVQRHGSRGFDPEQGDQHPAQIATALESFRQRGRGHDDPLAGFNDATERFLAARQNLGPGRACDLFFQAEREYWQARNRAAQVQFARQNKLGLGWANHDHHTYRCSREAFAPLIHFLETIGFQCRERFYAGSDAGWGAQVLEHPACGIVIFADVDMSEEELTGDFAHEGLAARDELGTVGLWCQLHGESFLSAGMHHLECQFDFEAARQQLSAVGIETMAPFTNFPHLKQAFTQGELWRVDRKRLDPLVACGAISATDAERFATQGALGSHLEILERNDGYKGFNQTGVSKIIKETDPRRATVPTP